MLEGAIRDGGAAEEVGNGVSMSKIPLSGPAVGLVGNMVRLVVVKPGYGTVKVRVSVGTIPSVATGDAIITVAGTVPDAGTDIDVTVEDPK